MNLRKREQTGLPLLVAEVGFNHEGSLDTAAALIRAAAESGADAVKFQTFKASDLALPSAPHYELIRAAEMRPEDARFLADTAREAGIAFFSTPFSLEAVAMLEAVDVPAYKIASMDVTTPYLLEAVARTGKPVILSTGMATLDEIGTALAQLQHAGATDIGLLHCLSLYPAQAEDCNLAAIDKLKRAFGLPTGWSDHYPGPKACLAAYFAGADIIETHFTLDREAPGGDHAHSLDPNMLRGLVEDLRLFERMQGSPSFFDNRPDAGFASAFRRGTHAARDLDAGEVPGPDDLLYCRPANGLSPAGMSACQGRPLARAVPRHTPLTREDFEDCRA